MVQVKPTIHMSLSCLFACLYSQNILCVMCHLGLVDALVTILRSRNTDVRIYTVVKEPQLLAQIILDCSVIADTKQLDIKEDMLISIEKWSHNTCFVLHQKRSELLGLTNKK